MSYITIGISVAVIVGMGMGMVKIISWMMVFSRRYTALIFMRRVKMRRMR
jgi:hypothetical protein